MKSRYSVARSDEGAKVTFMGAGEGPCIVLLLTAEARKYIGTMVLV
ncbi:mevalonate kinase [Paenibacillus sp. DS2015]